MDHLVRRFRDGRVSATDFVELKHWLDSNPDVPAGKWYKRFRAFTLAGEGEMPLTFLTPGMATDGEEVN